MKSEAKGTLIVTGASRGIGAAIARLAGQRGYAVALNFSSAKAERALGYHARSYVEGLRDAIDWFREFGYLR